MSRQVVPLHGHVPVCPRAAHLGYAQTDGEDIAFLHMQQRVRLKGIARVLGNVAVSRTAVLPTELGVTAITGRRQCGTTCTPSSCVEQRSQTRQAWLIHLVEGNHLPDLVEDVGYPRAGVALRQQPCGPSLSRHNTQMSKESVVPK